MAHRSVLALLAAAVLSAGCGGAEAPAPVPAPAPDATQAAPPADAPPAGGGFDVSSLRGPEEPKPEEPKPADPKPAEPKPGEPKPGESGPDPAAKETPAPAPPAKPEKAPPASPAEITDLEVLGTWAQDEREALNEMSPEDRAKEIEKRRLEIFKERGGTLAVAPDRTEEKPVVGPDGTRGPARPDAVPEKELPPSELRDILADIASRDPEIRARGVESANRYPDKTVACRHLLPLLEDRDAELRSIVCSTLGNLKQSDAVPALAKLIEKGDKDPVRATALKALGDIGGPRAREALRDIVREGEEPSDRATALGQLVRQREVGEVKDLLPKALDDLYGDVRQQAVAAIREFALKGFEKELFARLEDASEHVIVETIRTFGALGTREAVPALIKILLKPDPEADDPEAYQVAANMALEAITGTTQGYSDTLAEPQKEAAIDAWRVWWNRNKATWK